MPGTVKRVDTGSFPVRPQFHARRLLRKIVSHAQRPGFRSSSCGSNATVDIGQHPTTETMVDSQTIPTTQSPWPSRNALGAAFGATFPAQQQDVAVTVHGRLPPWLSGMYIRNGPGTYENGTVEGMNHMFDGYALLLKFDVDGANNQATMSHKFLESKAWQALNSNGRMKWREFGTAVPSNGIVDKITDFAQTALGALGIGEGVTDNASVSILPRPGGNRVWALTETVAGSYEIETATLQTLGRVRYSDRLRGDLTTAHPTVLLNGDVINLLSAPGVGFTVYRQSSGSTSREAVARVAHRRPISPAWIHDFPGSNTHIIIPETPLYFNLGSLVSGAETDHIFLDWRPEDGTKLHVVRLTDGFVRTVMAPPFFVFHWANAFESADGRRLHLDGAVYDDPTIVNHLSLANVRAGALQGPELPPSRLKRLTMDLTEGAEASANAGWEPLVEDDSTYGTFVEFPCVNPNSRGQDYQYAWGTAAVRPTNVNNALAKFDVRSKECMLWHEGGGLVGEPIFVARPGAVTEDDGVVVSVVTQADGCAALLVLDGQTHKEVARAVVPAPVQITNGFHGAFIPR